jgi:sortase (surface protein transpeptidase)
MPAVLLSVLSTVCIFFKFPSSFLIHNPSEKTKKKNQKHPSTQTQKKEKKTDWNDTTKKKRQRL